MAKADSPKEDLERRLSVLEDGVQKILTALGARDGDGDGQHTKQRKLTIKEQRARLKRPPAAEKPNGHLVAQQPQPWISDALRQMPEPRRQRKIRTITPRKMYSMKDVRSAQMIEALQTLTPAATSIVVYLVGHPKATVPDLVTQLDLKRKTIENTLSVLNTKGLIDVEDRH